MIKSKRDSGQSVVIGALLLLALFVGFLAWFQLTQIPILNQNSESEHHENIRSDLFEFQEKSYDTILNDNVNRASFTTRVTYEYQIAGFQDKIGQFSVTEFGDNPVEVNNANQSINNVPDSMISFQYKPAYIERTESSFVFENGILIEDNTTSLDRGGQNLVRGTDVFLFEYESSFTALQYPNPTLVVVPEEDLVETEITGMDGEDIEIRLNSTISIDKWQELLDNQGNVINVEEDGEYILVTLDGSEEYTISTGKARIEQ